MTRNANSRKVRDLEIYPWTDQFSSSSDHDLQLETKLSRPLNLCTDILPLSLFSIYSRHLYNATQISCSLSVRLSCGAQLVVNSFLLLDLHIRPISLQKIQPIAKNLPLQRLSCSNFFSVKQCYNICNVYNIIM